MTLLIVYLVFFLISLYFIKRASAYAIISLPIWILLAYSFLLLSHIFSPFTFHSGDYENILIYVFFALFLLIIGFYLGLSSNFPIVRSFFSININKLFYISVLGGGLAAFDFFRLNTIVLGMRIEDQQLSTIGVLGTFLSCFGIIVWLYYLYFYIIEFKTLNYKAYLGVITYLVFTILSGGRQAILLTFLSSLIIVLWGHKYLREHNVPRKKRKKPIGVYFFLLLMITYFAIVSATRTQIFDIDDKMDMFEEESMARIDPNYREFARHFFAADIFIEAAFYYSHELTRLDIFYKNYDFVPMLGTSQCLYFSRRIQWLVGDLLDKSSSAQIEAVEVKGQFSSHTWGTFITNYIVDFGKLGALIACLISGFVVGITTKRCRESSKPFLIIRQGLICAGLIFSIQFSPFAEMCWFIPILFLSFVDLKTNE